MAEELYGLPAKLEDPIMAPEPIGTLVNECREKWHKSRLEGARIAVVLIPKGPVSGGMVSLGHTSALGPIVRLLANTDFVIRIAWDVWQHLEEAQRRALVDHELTHCDRKVGKNGAMLGWRLRKHDIGEFAAVIQHHGLWTGQLEVAGAVIAKRQKTLFEGAGEAAPGEDPGPLPDGVLRAAKKFADDIGRNPNLESVTLSTPGRRPIVIKGGAARKAAAPAA